MRAGGAVRGQGPLLPPLAEEGLPLRSTPFSPRCGPSSFFTTRSRGERGLWPHVVCWGLGREKRPARCTPFRPLPNPASRTRLPKSPEKPSIFRPRRATATLSAQALCYSQLLPAKVYPDAPFRDVCFSAPRRGTNLSSKLPFWCAYPPNTRANSGVKVFNFSLPAPRPSPQESAQSAADTASQVPSPAPF